MIFHRYKKGDSLSAGVVDHVNITEIYSFAVTASFTGSKIVTITVVVNVDLIAGNLNAL